MAAVTAAGLFASTVALGAPASADVEETIRIAGDNRYETAYEAGQGGPDEAPTLVRSLLQKCGVSINVVVASGQDYPDALAASAKAGFKGVGLGLGVPDPLFDAPVLLTEQDQLSEPTRFYIDTCGRIIGGDQTGGIGNLVRPFNVWIVGGRDAVSKTVEDQLLRIDNVLRVDRLDGDNRYETAAEVMRNVERRNPVLGVRGLCLVDDSFNDQAIRFNSLGRTTASGDNLNVTQFEYGTSTVSEKVAELEAEYEVVDLESKEALPASEDVVAQQTLEAMVQRGIEDRIPCDGDYYQDAVFVATGQDFSDALAAGPQAYKGHPVLLTKKDELPDVTLRAIQELDETLIIILGGTDAVSQAVEDRLFTAGDILRIGGDNRYDTARNLNNVLIQDVGFVIPDYIPLNVGVASGQDYPDALAASSYLGSAYAPLALVKQDDVPSATREFFQRWASWPPGTFLPEPFGPGVTFTHTFGGVEAVDRDVEQEIVDIVDAG